MVHVSDTLLFSVTLAPLIPKDIANFIPNLAKVRSSSVIIIFFEYYVISRYGDIISQIYDKIFVKE